jgi:hypothetical protein
MITFTGKVVAAEIQSSQHLMPFYGPVESLENHSIILALMSESLLRI